MTDDPSSEDGAEIDERRPLESVFHHATETAQEDGDLSINEVLETFGARSLGPLLILFGLIAATPPLGAIPGVPTTMGVLTVLCASQFAAGRQRVWLPGFIANRAVGADKMEAAERRAAKVTSKIDALVRQRAEALTDGVAARLVALAACALGVMMPPLELVPFGVAVPGAALVLMGIGIAARDGAFLIMGLAIGAATIGLIVLGVPWHIITGWLS